MPSITLTPGTAAVTNNGDGSLQDWGGLQSHATAEDGSTAVSNCISNQKSYYLLLTNFNFAAHLPPDATILGIQSGIKKRSGSGTSTPANFVDNLVQLLYGSGTLPVVGIDKSDTITRWPSDLTFEYYGSSTDTWSWADADYAHVTDASFGFAIQCWNSGAGPGEGDVDVGTLTVWYDSQSIDLLVPCCLPPMFQKPEVVSYP